MAPTIEDVQIHSPVLDLTTPPEPCHGPFANEYSMALNSSATLSSSWVKVDLSPGSTSLGPAAMDTSPESGRRAYTPTSSDFSDFSIASIYGGSAVSLTSPQSFVCGSSPAFSGRDLSDGLDGNGAVPEVGLHPADYISGRGWYDEPFSPASVGTHLLPEEVSSNNLVSAPPSMVSALSSLELGQPLTRQNSAIDCGNGVCMMRLQSRQSYRTDQVCTQGQDFSLALGGGGDCVMASTAQADLLAIGSGFASVHGIPPSPISTAAFLNHTSPRSMQLSAPNMSSIGDRPGSLPVQLSASNMSSIGDRPGSLSVQLSASNMSSTSDRPSSLAMQPSVSNVSSISARSPSCTAEPRICETLKKDAKNGKAIKIRPKSNGTSDDKAAKSSKKGGRGGVAPHKASYRRPRGPRVYCNKCNGHPDGFRGRHELQRHDDTKHKRGAKKFVCRDPATVGLSSSVVAIRPLSQCKACVKGKKYNKNYNAAAHLRRNHFSPKCPRGKTDDEKKAGSSGGGGTLPSMSELNPWLEIVMDSCVAEEAPESDSPLIDDAGENDDMDWVLEQTAKGVASEHDVADNYNLKSADTQTQYPNRLLIGDDDVSVEDAEMKESFGTMSLVNDWADMVTSVDDDVNFA